MGDEMKAVQKRLALEGFDPGPLDGKGGPQSAKALEGFLRKVGIPVAVLATATAFTLTPAPAPRALNPAPADLPWMIEARKVLNRHETRDKSFLAKWLKSDGRTLGDPEKLPWCGDFVETCLRLALPAEPFPGALGDNPYWARNWALLGREVAPCYGAVLAFERPGGGGHVGFAVGYDAANFFVLGGNQSNAVTIARIAKSRLLASRYPATYPNPRQPLPLMSAAGTIITTNEA
jgi:uncharacterized protein (TIGR02594 family)